MLAIRETETEKLSERLAGAWHFMGSTIEAIEDVQTELGITFTQDEIFEAQQRASQR